MEDHEGLIIRFQCEKCGRSFNSAIMPFFEKVKCSQCGSRELLIRYVTSDMVVPGDVVMISSKGFKFITKPANGVIIE